VISGPNWCKEDYFQAAWDCTPGKSGIFVKYLTTDETNALKKKYNTSVAGIFVHWNAPSNSGDGLVLGFDLDKGFTMSHSDTGSSWAWKLKMDEILMDFASSPEDFVSTIKFHLESLNDLLVLQAAGANPQKVLGLEFG
jgi:formylmethanofuran dehydrogenase subunit E-like metal-binding protein